MDKLGDLAMNLIYETKIELIYNNVGEFAYSTGACRAYNHLIGHACQQVHLLIEEIAIDIKEIPRFIYIN